MGRIPPRSRCHFQLYPAPGRKTAQSPHAQRSQFRGFQKIRRARLQLAPKTKGSRESGSLVTEITLPAQAPALSRMNEFMNLLAAGAGSYRLALALGNP